jgi:hypothetical protein
MSEQIRIRLPKNVAVKLADLPPSARSTAVASLLVSASSGVDLDRLIGAVDEIRRLGVLLNQSLRLAYNNKRGLDEQTAHALTQALNFITQLRGDL